MKKISVDLIVHPIVNSVQSAIGRTARMVIIQLGDMAFTASWRMWDILARKGGVVEQAPFVGLGALVS